MIMKSKTCLLLILSIFIFGKQPVRGQETGETLEKRTHEIFLYGSLKELDLTGVAFKSEIKKDRFIRVAATKLTFLNINNEPEDDPGNRNRLFSGSVQVGLENRHRLTERLSAFYGIDLSAGVMLENSETTYPEYVTTSHAVNFMPGLSFGSGLILNVIKNFSVSLELEPSVLLSFGSVETEDQTGTESHRVKACIVNFNIDDVRLALIYHW